MADTRVNANSNLQRPAANNSDIFLFPPPAYTTSFPYRPSNRGDIMEHHHPDQEETNNNITVEDMPIRNGCIDTWSWSKLHRSPEVVLTGPQQRTAFFHPNWSKGTAGVRGTKVLNNGRYFWEIQLSHRVFGTR